MDKFKEEYKLFLTQKGLETMPNIPENIKMLDIRRNKLPDLRIPKDSCIEYIDASDNLIQSLDNISGISTLQILDVGYNLISSLPKLELPELREFYIMSNDIQEIKNINFQKLQKIDMANNEIETLESLDSPELVEAYFGANKISKVQNISKLIKLKILDLQFNELKELDCECLPSNIEVLLVNDNRELETIKNIQNLKHLKILGLKNTGVKHSEIPQDIEIW